MYIGTFSGREEVEIIYETKTLFLHYYFKDTSYRVSQKKSGACLMKFWYKDIDYIKNIMDEMTEKFHVLAHGIRHKIHKTQGNAFPSLKQYIHEHKETLT